MTCAGVACSAGQVTDCNGSCTSPNFEGDGGCDDGSLFIDDLFCPYFNWDGGDCGPVDTGTLTDTSTLGFDGTGLLDTGATNATLPLIISEVCDHATSPSARYVEIYNPNANATIDLSTWALQRYANGQITPATVNLSGLLAPNDVVVIGSSQSVFEGEFGPGVADLFSGLISGNGDDTYLLTESGALIDIYGAFGVDGTGEPWEYKDAIATRLPGMTATTDWDATEWSIVTGTSTATPGSH